MDEAVIRVRELLKGKQGVGLLYYAGHGIQLDWRNDMVPVDAKLNSAADVRGQTVDINTVIDAFMAADNCMNIMVLDACRDNPIGGTASAKGLAQLDAPLGTFLAFATAPGNVAEDGDARDGNDLYTRFLLEDLKNSPRRPSKTCSNACGCMCVGRARADRCRGSQPAWRKTSFSTPDG